jgi:DNA-directed RNA polymerase specialized sigma24 family protein
VSGFVQPKSDVVLVGFGRKTRCLGGVKGEAGEPSLGEANAALAGIEVSLWLRHCWSEVAQIGVCDEVCLGNGLEVLVAGFEGWLTLPSTVADCRRVLEAVRAGRRGLCSRTQAMLDPAGLAQAEVWPPPRGSVVEALHRAVMAGSAGAREVVARVFWDVVKASLQRGRFGAADWDWVRGDGHLIEEAVGAGIVTYLEGADRFDPQRGDLGRYLVGLARHKLRDLLRRERRHRGRAVEWCEGDVDLALGQASLESHDALAKGGEALWLEREERLNQWLAKWSESDRRGFELMQRGERDANAYAPLLGISELPLAEQQNRVVREKRRLWMRLVRWARSRAET